MSIELNWGLYLSSLVAQWYTAARVGNSECQCRCVVEDQRTADPCSSWAQLLREQLDKAPVITGTSLTAAPQISFTFCFSLFLVGVVVGLTCGIGLSRQFDSRKSAPSGAVPADVLPAGAVVKYQGPVTPSTKKNNA